MKSSTYISILAVMLLLALGWGCNRNKPSYETKVLETGSPPGARPGAFLGSSCRAGVVVVAKKDENGGLLVKTGTLDATTAEDSTSVPVPGFCFEKIPGLPSPKMPDSKKLDYGEKALLFGYCSLIDPQSERLALQQPFGRALLEAGLYWKKLGKLPTGDYALVFAKDIPLEERSAKAFWSQPEGVRDALCASFYNPLRGSVIRINPPVDKSPGDIYMEPIKLTPEQVSKLAKWLEPRVKSAEPAFICTVWDTKGEILLRGIAFLSERVLPQTGGQVTEGKQVNKPK
jgi:hypothetical protein